MEEQVIDQVVEQAVNNFNAKDFGLGFLGGLVVSGVTAGATIVIKKLTKKNKVKEIEVNESEQVFDKVVENVLEEEV